jgi:hypothetical protein
LLVIATTLEIRPATAAPAFPASALRIIHAKGHLDGSIEFQVDASHEFKVLIESSTDLKDWSSEGLWEPNTTLLFTNGIAGEQRFYRAADFTLHIHGYVRDMQTDMPVGDAKVTISHFAPQANDTIGQTDSQGVFDVVVSREHPIETIKVEKSGYVLLTTELQIDPTISNFEVSLLLAPPGERPANDDFQNRFTIEGTNVLVQASTFGATSEPGHTLDVSFDDYSQYYDKNLWWTWTAPKDGAVMLKRGDITARYGSGAVVYTGQSLPDLVRIWDSSNPDDAFFVKQGVQYQIGFGTVSPSLTSFTLEMVAPVPPVNVIAWIGDQLVIGSPVRAVGEAIYLSVRADGTSPLSYQWRKDGIDIPEATSTFFFKDDIELTDAGTYSVSVSNEAGTTFSDDILITVLQARP